MMAVSPDTLAEMISAKSLTEFQALGGLVGLVRRLRTDCSAGLSVGETCSHDADCQLCQDRKAVFGTNRLPERKSQTFLQLVLVALSDRVLIILSVVAAISLSLGLYQSIFQPHAPGQPRVEWVDGVTIMMAVVIVVVAGAFNDYQREQQFARLNKKVSGLVFLLLSI